MTRKEKVLDATVVDLGELLWLRASGAPEEHPRLSAWARAAMEGRPAVLTVSGDDLLALQQRLEDGLMDELLALGASVRQLPDELVSWIPALLRELGDEPATTTAVLNALIRLGAVEAGTPRTT